MSRSRRALLFLLAVALSVCYASARKISDRYTAHQEREKALESMREEARALEEALDKEKRRAQELGSNPLELEASIRRLNGNVRPGETVYRVELSPDAGRGQ